MFAGAGFSRGAQNVEQKSPPLASDLANEICRLGGFSTDDDLRYATDYYLSNHNPDSLVSLLKNKYTLNKVDSTHVSICSANWRRFYTTNYDKCIEMACAEAGQVVECIDTSYSTSEYYPRNGLCIHLNGSIDSLDKNSLENSFKLSTSSYISADSFVNSQWYYYFRKDLERTSALVFVGYSMYDIEIQKILFENQSLKDRTYFITEENPDPKSIFTLSKFGTVVPIEIEGFAKLMNDNLQLFESYVEQNELQALSLYEVSSHIGDIKDSNVETMLAYGDIDNYHIDDGVIGDQRIPYLVIRDQVKMIHEFLCSGDNVIVCGEFGNEKSILLKELKSFLSVNFFSVYDIVDWEGDYIGDIDILTKSVKNVVIIVDGYERYYDLITHFCQCKPNNIGYVLVK